MTFHIALVGNPNCGKTTFFNEITGSSQYVGNWPGVTVEKKEGKLLNKTTDAMIVDLPGIYSLSPYSPEEIVTRNYIIEENPDLIINIVDATNLERNLYLSTQLMELGKPMIIALNMVDMLKSLGITIDAPKLENELGLPIFPISASKSIGTKELIHHAIHILHDIAHTKISDPNFDNDLLKKADDMHMKLHSSHLDLNENYRPFKKAVTSFYSADVTEAINMIEAALLMENTDNSNHFNAVKIFEDDPVVEKSIHLNDRAKRQIKKAKDLILLSKNVDRQIIIADQRYKFICKICEKAVNRKKAQNAHTLSDKIDRVLTHKILALPVFFLLMFLIFNFTFGVVGNFFSAIMDNLINVRFAEFIQNMFVHWNVAPFLTSLICDGMIAGVGAVLSFFPQIMLLFLCLGILEDSGYMSRAAFIMDRLLSKIGLSGKSFVPMLMGFGCSVPAILATRTLENEKDKRLTILLVPFMSCSAKMPVYLLFISAFFAKNQPLIIFSIYLFGILTAIIISLICGKTVLKGEHSTFVMELPSYRLPTLKGLLMHVWERAKDFLTRAGTILLLASVIIWFLSSFNFSFQMVGEGEGSILEYIGKAIAPVFTPLGFGFWEASVSLLTGLIAKESVISTFGVLIGSTNDAEIIAALTGKFSTLASYSFMIFVLCYTPCIAALSTIVKEMKSIKWSAFAIILQLGVAYIASLLVYQIGSLFL